MRSPRKSESLNRRSSIASVRLAPTTMLDIQTSTDQLLSRLCSQRSFSSLGRFWHGCWRNSQRVASRHRRQAAGHLPTDYISPKPSKAVSPVHLPCRTLCSTCFEPADSADYRVCRQKHSAISDVCTTPHGLATGRCQGIILSYRAIQQGRQRDRKSVV